MSTSNWSEEALERLLADVKVPKGKRNLAALLAGRLEEDDLTDKDILEIELELMDLVAIKAAGGEGGVFWEASAEYH
jgi:hypothetical protein